MKFVYILPPDISVVSKFTTFGMTAPRYLDVALGLFKPSYMERPPEMIRFNLHSFIDLHRLRLFLKRGLRGQFKKDSKSKSIFNRFLCWVKGALK